MALAHGTFAEQASRFKLIFLQSANLFFLRMYYVLNFRNLNSVEMIQHR